MNVDPNSTLDVVQLALQSLQVLERQKFDAGGFEPNYRKLLMMKYMEWVDSRDISNMPNIESLPWRPKVGVGVMVVRQGKVLLGRRRESTHGAGTYGWCGGHLEYGETPEECAKREVFEETQLQITALKFLCLSNITEYNTHYIDIEFLADIMPSEPILTEPEKVESWRWYDIDHLPSPLFMAAQLAINSYSTGQFYFSG